MFGVVVSVALAIFCVCAGIYRRMKANLIVCQWHWHWLSFFPRQFQFEIASRFFLLFFLSLLFPLSNRRFFHHMDISMVCDLNWIYSVAEAFRYIMRRQSINVTLQPLLWETSGKFIKQPPLYRANEGKKTLERERE